MKTYGVLFFVLCMGLSACSNEVCKVDAPTARYQIVPSPPSGDTTALQYTIFKHQRNDSLHQCKTDIIVINNPNKLPALDSINLDLKEEYKQLANCGIDPDTVVFGPVNHSDSTSILINNGTILGINADTYWFGGHIWKPCIWHHTFYYNVSTGERLLLSNLFDENTLQKLNKLCREKCLWLGLDPDLKGVEDFTVDIKAKTFTIHLDPFLYLLPAMIIEPWAATFTFAEIKPFIKKESIFNTIIP